MNWRLDGRQGFISSGQSEILAPAVGLTGDGFWIAPMDWRLQKDQAIEVRVRSRMLDFLTANLDPAFVDDADRTLRWIVVTFWAEEMNQPSAR